MYPPPLLLGLDAGGTKTALLGRGPAGEIRCAGPGANLKRDGLEAAVAALAGAVAEAAAGGVHAAVAVCVGVAGAGSPEDRSALAEALHARLAAHFPDAELHLDVQHDGVLALEAALGAEGSGLVAVVGTGSVLLARSEGGEVVRAAGWGERLGDYASGAALGRAALAAVADDFDGGEPTLLRHRLAEAHGVREPGDLIRLVYEDRIAFATLAPMVLGAAAVPDWVATRILQREATALAQRAAWLAARAEEAGGVTRRAALLGGLGTHELYREVLAEALLRFLPEWRIVRAQGSPVEAALARAERLYAAVSRE